MDGAAGVDDEDEELLESVDDESLALFESPLFESLFESFLESLFESLFGVDAPLSPAGGFPFCE